jgi:putative transcriptional regulator
MARIAFEKIMAGLDDALAYTGGDSTRGTAHQVKVADVDITHLREKLGLSQDRFAALFGLSARTVRNWEQGVRHPEGPARILLQVIDREPEAVMRALRGGADSRAGLLVAEGDASYRGKRRRVPKGCSGE